MARFSIMSVPFRQANPKSGFLFVAPGAREPIFCHPMNFLQTGGWIGGALYGVAALVVLYLWRSDWKNGRTNGFPGASGAPLRVLMIAGLGGVLLTLLETAGEYALGLSAEQSELAAFALVPLLAAAVIEEVVFRGYLVVENRGRVWLWGSVVVFSLIFAVIHPYIWSWEDGHLSIEWTTKGLFSTFFIFVSSLWFYAVRFAFGNHSRSLLPCFIAHGAANFSVWAVKGFQGFLIW